MNTNLTNLTMKAHCRSKCIKKYTKAINKYKPHNDLRYARNESSRLHNKLIFNCERIYNVKNKHAIRCNRSIVLVGRSSSGEYDPPSLRRIYNFKDQYRKMTFKSCSKIEKKRSLSLEDLPIYITLKVAARRKYGSG